MGIPDLHERDGPDGQKPLHPEPARGGVPDERLQIRQGAADAAPQLLPQQLLQAVDRQRDRRIYRQDGRLHHKAEPGGCRKGAAQLGGGHRQLEAQQDRGHQVPHRRDAHGSEGEPSRPDPRARHAAHRADRPRRVRHRQAVRLHRGAQAHDDQGGVRRLRQELHLQVHGEQRAQGPLRMPYQQAGEQLQGARLHHQQVLRRRAHGGHQAG